MAADVVRITYQELEEIARINDQKAEAQKLAATKEAVKKKRDEEREKRRAKRPTRGIYQPPSIIRHKQQIDQEGDAVPQTESWDLQTDTGQRPPSTDTWDDDTGSSSKENSVEKELEPVSTAIKNLQLAASKEHKTSSNESRRRSKRPEIQRYVPKGKILEQQQIDSEETWIDGVDLDSPASPAFRGSQHSPSPQPVSSPSPRKIDLKNMQVTVLNEAAKEDADSQTAQSKSVNQSSKSAYQPQQSKAVNQQAKPGTQIQAAPQSKPTPPPNQPGTPPSQAQAAGHQTIGQGQGQRGQPNVRGHGHRLGQRGSRHGNVNPSHMASKGRGRSVGEEGKEEERKPHSHQQNQDLYIVPSRPNTIGQEADRTDTIGKEDDKVNESETAKVPDDREQSMVNRFNKLKPNRSKSKSFDRLNKTEKWDDEEYYTDPAKMGTLVFERSRSSDQLNVSDRKPPMPRTGSMTKTPKKYSFSAMRRPRADSFSSDMSTGTGSDWSTEDLDFDKDVDSKILDWDKEVERELALQVQDETQKMNEWFERQESGLSQSRGNNYPKVDMSGEGERCNTLPFDSRHKKRVNENRGRKKERRRGSFDVHSRDSSVASVASVQSVQSAYSGDGRRRRRRRRKSSSGSAYSGKMRSGSTEPRNMNIKVTCAQNNKREVKVDTNIERDQKNKEREKFGQRRGEKEHDSRDYQDHYNRNQDHSGRQPRNRSKEKMNKEKEQVNKDHNQQARDKDFNRKMSNKQNEPFYPRENPRERWNKGDRDRRHEFQKETEQSRHDRGKPGRTSPYMDSMGGTPPKGGGLLHIPTASTNPQAQHSQQIQNAPQQRHGHHGPSEHHDQHYRGMGRGRNNSGGSRQKTLFDPNNPTKPIVISQSKPKLDFKDTDDHYSMSPGSPQYPNPETVAAQGYPAGPPPFYPPAAYGYGYNNDPHFARGPPPPMMRPGLGAERMYYGYPVAPMDSTLYQDDTYARDPYYHDGGHDQESVIVGNSRSQCRMMAEHLLREALPLDKQLNSLVARRIGGEDTLHMINQLRRELQVRLEQVVLLDPDLANKQNVEQILWKSVFYQMVELSRKQLADDKDEESKAKLIKILEEGNSFYEVLLQKLQTTFKFKLDVYLDPNALPPDNLSRTIKLALLSVQRTMICLGDIARYKEQSNETGKVNYAKARSWYTKAQQIAPKNGRPYNQLAILALYTRRKLDAVYYYMRSLAASNPFLTARESLMSLFDEARKKAEDMEKKRAQERIKQDKIRANKTTHKHRVEIWVRGDGSSSQDKVIDDYSEDLSKINAVELNKRFVLSFLNVHGKLFTKIGMEMFPDSCGQMLQEFSALCKDNAIGPSRFLQLMAVNMFAIENTALKDESLESTCRSLLQEHAVQLGLDMFGILIDQCSQQLEQHLKSADYPSHMFSRELEELVPSVKVWTDWMICHADLWNPPPAVRDPAMGPEIDVWSCTARLCNILKDMDTSHVKFYAEKKESCDPVILSEDTMMSGFVPLLSTPLSNTFVHNTVEKEIAKDCLRIEKLRVFGEYLCGIEPPMLAYNVEKREYYSVALSQGYEEDKEGEAEQQDMSEDDDIVIESEEEVVCEEGEEGEDHVQKLRAKKEELQKKMQEKVRQQENIQNILEKNRHKSIELEIRPIFLIPDTNCFIDHLPSLKKLIDDKHYTIIIPLVVINELDGLAQGSREGQFHSEDHASKVKLRAKATVDYLEQEFEKKNTHLKAQTSKGSVMETIAFRSEETDSSGNNDDLILSCCLHYCKDKARDFMPKDKDSPVRLYRDVVLLTDDRNLRLKAHTCNVPVKDVPSFMAWSTVK